MDLIQELYSGQGSEYEKKTNYWKLIIILLRVFSVGWILQYGTKAHYKKDGRLRMISCIFIMYQVALVCLLAFESWRRYI